MLAARPARATRTAGVWGLVCMALLVCVLVASRGVLMNLAALEAIEAAEVTPVHSHQGQTAPESKKHAHAQHCPLCFVQWLTAGSPGVLEAVFANARFARALWLSAAQARDEFLNSVAARGPPPQTAW